MARHVGKHGARHSLWGGVAVFVVIALTGFLLSTNVRVNRTVAATNDTADLVEQGVDEANQLQQDVSDLTNRSPILRTRSRPMAPMAPTAHRTKARTPAMWIPA